MENVSIWILIPFVIFTILTLGGAMGVVLNRNLFRGTIWLMVSLFGVAGYYVLLSAPFLALVQVLVYIGAIAVLFTFAVMLTRSLTQLTDRFTRLSWNIATSLILFALLLIGVILPVWFNNPATIQPASALVASTTDLGIALVDKYGFVVPFEVASLLLTAAMIGAIVIAREAED